MATASDCIHLIYLGISIAALVYICKIYSLTKVDALDTNLDNPEEYFFSSIQTFSTMGKQCKCRLEIVNDFCTEEQILSGCVDTYLNPNLDKQKFIRFLLDEAQCKSYELKLKIAKD